MREQAGDFWHSNICFQANIVMNNRNADLRGAIEERVGAVTRLPGSRSLIETASGLRIYMRYSKMHAKGATFYGLRQVDLNALDGHRAYICFSSDTEPPLFVPYGDFEAVIRQSPLASDGQYKAQVIHGASSKELYLPRVGHFNVDAFGGLDTLSLEDQSADSDIGLSLSHCQAQTLLGGIGVLKGYGVYIPSNNVDLLDWSLVERFHPINSLPNYIEDRARFASEIDVIWVDHKHDLIVAAFEVEHSTPVYSGLLRFNDVLLTCSGANRFFVVSNESRRELFARQLQRPTFQRSGLSEVASFLDYTNVYHWHRRLNSATGERTPNAHY
jgi:hypothetical protein